MLFVMFCPLCLVSLNELWLSSKSTEDGSVLGTNISRGLKAQMPTFSSAPATSSQPCRAASPAFPASRQTELQGSLSPLVKACLMLLIA